MSPKAIGVRRKTDEQIVAKFGLNYEQVKILADANPTEAIGTLAHDYGKFLLAGTSAVELKWRSVAPSVVEAVFGERVVWVGRESWEFKLPGARYTADFYYQFESGRFAIVEVKASKLQPGYRDARSKLVCAATLYPMFLFFEARPDKAQDSGWVFERIKPDETFAQVFIDLMEAK